MLMLLFPISPPVVRAFVGDSMTTTIIPSTRLLVHHATYGNRNHSSYALSHLPLPRAVAKRFHSECEYRRSRWRAIASLCHDSPQPGWVDSAAVCLAPNVCLARTLRPTSTWSLLLVVLIGMRALVSARRKVSLPHLSRKARFLSRPRSR
jgi:hypothetical protein